jgi:hypothetical protein
MTKPTMDNTLKQKWVDALRSGEYEQGRGMLRCKTDDSDQFCCLGVLCDVYDPSQWSYDTDAGSSWVVDAVPYKGSSFTYLKDELLSELGISDDTQGYLTVMNDMFCTFLQIADRIESLDC